MSAFYARKENNIYVARCRRLAQFVLGKPNILALEQNVEKINDIRLYM